MSPNTQVALIALVLFFAVASVSIFWPRLAGLEAHRKGRSLSSHLQTSRWTWPMAMSLMHRISGGALGLVTILLLAFWLLSMGRARRFFGSPLGLAILFVYTLALMQYLAIGIRHLIWHFGYGTEPEMRRNMVRATPMAAVLLTSLIWVGVQLRHGTPPSVFDRSARTAVKP
jgi:succinate dehydrogenase / fumarate reductase cytochrome b subunit